MTIKKMSLGDFFSYINLIQKPYPGHFRFGQNAFTFLYGVRADIAHELVATEFDPFADDKNVPKFLSKLLSDFVEFQ